MVTDCSAVAKPVSDMSKMAGARHNDSWPLVIALHRKLLSFLDGGENSCGLQAAVCSVCCCRLRLEAVMGRAAS